MEAKSCSIVFEPEKNDILVVFDGDWTRRNIEQAYSSMFREYPKYIMARRQALENSKKEVKENGRRKRREG